MVLRKAFRIIYTIIVILFMISLSFAEKDLIPYISPGIEIGFGRVVYPSVTAKISIGAHTPALQFVNITYGRTLLPKSKYAQLKNGFRFVEIEGGSLVEFPLIAGGGCGIGFVVDNGVRVIPKVSLFAGSWLFLRTDIYITSKFKIPLLINTGPMFTMPISPIIMNYE